MTVHQLQVGRIYEVTAQTITSWLEGGGVNLVTLHRGDQVRCEGFNRSDYGTFLVTKGRRAGIRVDIKEGNLQHLREIDLGTPPALRDLVK